MTMRCYVNGELLSTGNTKDMKWTFEIIENFLWSRTFSRRHNRVWNCWNWMFSWLNGTAKTKNSDHLDRWIQENDEIVMRIDGLGKYLIK